MDLPPFDVVVTDHGTVVLRVLRATLGHADADDAWQETFLSALRAYPRLRPGSDVRAWLVTIAHRKAVDVARGHARRAVPVAGVPEAPASAPPVDDDAARVVDALAAGGLWGDVAALPEKQRLAVAYRYGADLAYDDIGRLLECSAEAARRSAFEGVRRLRTTVTWADTADGGPRGARREDQR
ncbi:MAG: RNA polymerase sigma factor [Kineosporiaceae bacterium]